MLLATMMIGATMVAMVVPAASAHACSEYDDRCNPHGCTDGEEHEHTRMHYWPQRDEHCESHKKEPTNTCHYMTLEFPAVICKILNGSAGPSLPSLSDVQNFPAHLPGCSSKMLHFARFFFGGMVPEAPVGC